MIDDNMPHRVFKISELTRVIASHLTPAGSGSAVNPACSCRCLEEPVLSTLWETQPSLQTLLKVLPEETSGISNIQHTMNMWYVAGTFRWGNRALKFGVVSA